MKPNRGAKIKRQYPRAVVQASAKITVPGDRAPRFEAVLKAANVSVGGIFFESTFFLKLGQVVDVELNLASDLPKIHARGRIVRVEQVDEGRKARSGFAVKFDQYVDGSEIALARYFLAPALRAFVEKYAKDRAVRTSAQYLDDAVDLLAAWELSKTEATDLDLWRFSEEEDR